LSDVVRLLIDDHVVYEGTPIPVPRVGDTSVTLLLAAAPYAY
jgi:hypothetical protein